MRSPLQTTSAAPRSAARSAAGIAHIGSGDARKWFSVPLCVTCGVSD